MGGQPSAETLRWIRNGVIRFAMWAAAVVNQFSAGMRTEGTDAKVRKLLPNQSIHLHNVAGLRPEAVAVYYASGYRNITGVSLR